MSLWKKAAKVNQKVHRERHQPISRSHLGLLEKKKDYKIRADEFNKKQNVLKNLKIKSLNKNPDEFYFHMVNSKLVDGKHVELNKKQMPLSDEQIKLIYTQKSAYISMKRTEEAKQIQKLMSQLHMSDIVLSENPKPLTNLNDIFASSSSGHEKDNHKRFINRSEAESILRLTHTDIDNINKKKQKSYEELLKRINRVKGLELVQRNVELQQALRDKKVRRPTLVKKGSKNEAPVYCWPYERKR